MLEEVKQIFNDIRDAIIEMGVDVDYCDSPAEYASKILSISGGEGRTLLFVPVFKSSETKPSKPTGTMSAFNPTDYPDGWSTPDGLSTPIWMSYTIVGTVMTYVPWTEPICLSGNSGSSGGSTSGDGTDDSLGDLRYRLFTVYGYTATDVDALTAPTGGKWDVKNDTLTGLVSSTITGGNTVTWLTEFKSDYADSFNTWISSAVFASNGNLCGSWTEPFRIAPYSGSGSGSGSTGTDGISIFTSFAFTTLPDDQDISNYTVEGGTYAKPTPTITKDANGNVIDSITWTDGPNLTTGTVWMVSAIFSNKDGSTIIRDWSQPKPLTDTADIEIIYTAIDPYNVIPDGFAKAANGIDIDATWYKAATNNKWYDDASNCTNELGNPAYPIYMAVNKMLHNKWQGWQIMKIKGEKGEKGENGTSINVKGTYANKEALDADWKAGKISPAVGDAYIIDGELWVFDGDDFTNCGTFHGGSYLYVAYSNDGGNTFTAEITENAGIGTTVGKYIGICVTDSATRPTTVSSYTWSKWQGTDGFGYEAVFALTTTYVAPEKPADSDKDEYKDDVWQDDHEDVTQDKPYCWYCWRKKVPDASGIAKWGSWKGPYLFTKWSIDALSLSLDQDTLTVYYVDGTNVSGNQVVTATLYSGSADITSGAEFSLSDYNGCNETGVTISNNQITIKDIDTTGSVKVNATYNNMVFTKILRLKKNVNEVGYELKLTKDFVLLNTTTGVYAPSSVTISVCRDTPTLDGVVHEVIGSADDSGLQITINGSAISSWEATGYVLAFSNAITFPCKVVLTKNGEYQEDETIDISKHTDGSGETGDTYIPKALYQTSASYSTAPTVDTSVTTTYNVSEDALYNTPTGWTTSTTVTTDKPYLWEITGYFSKKTGSQVGSWYGPICKTGIPGPAGEAGDETQEVFALSDVAVTPTINESTTDSNGNTNTADNYLPTFMFNSTHVEAVAEKQSVSSAYPYLYGAYRRKHNGTWSKFFTPYLVANYVTAALTDEELNALKAQVGEQVSKDVTEAKEMADTAIARLNKFTDATGNFTDEGVDFLESAITEKRDSNYTTLAERIVDKEQDTIKDFAISAVDDTIRSAGTNIDGLNAIVQDYVTWSGEEEGSINYVTSKISAHEATLQNVASTSDVQGVTESIQKLDGRLGTAETTVSKSVYAWVKRSTTEKYSDGTYKITETKEYNWDNTAYDTMENYDAAMENQGYEKITVVKTLSTITQEVGKITIAANEGKSWATIVAEANEATGSNIYLNADRINMKGETTAEQAIIGKATITDSEITNGTISKATITSCTIESQLKSLNYDKDNKTGFLFDAASQTGDFAIYAKSGNKDVIISSNEVKIPSAAIESLTSNKITFTDDSGTPVGAVTVGNTTYGEGSLGAALNLSSPAIQLTSGQITFTKSDNSTPYASFSEAVSEIVGDLNIGGNVTAKALKTTASNSGTTTTIEEGVAKFVSGANAQNWVEIGVDDNNEMVLKFYSNGSCLYNLGPAGFKKV